MSNINLKKSYGLGKYKSYNPDKNFSGSLQDDYLSNNHQNQEQICSVEECSCCLNKNKKLKLKRPVNDIK